METYLDYFRSEFANGRTQSEVIAAMKHRGLTIIEAIKAARELFGVGLGDAKQMVATHPEYKDIAAAVEPLHEGIIRVLEDESEQHSGWSQSRDPHWGSC